MHSSAIIFLFNVSLVILSIASLCFSTSIFDFIVTSRLYYTLPDEKVLISPDMIYWFYPTSILCFLLAFASVTFNNSPDIFINFAVKYQVILSILHSVLLSVSAIVSAFCCYLCANLANDVGKYAYHATPAQFQHASNWYFQRLRISGLIFALESVLSLLVLCVLYLGIQCRYRTFAQVPTKSVPDIIQKTTTFFQ